MGDFDKIWREHCEDERTLSEYALAMKNLADHHWTKKTDGEGRIEWCRRYDSPPPPPPRVTDECDSSSTRCLLPPLQRLPRVLLERRNEKNVGEG